LSPCDEPQHEAKKPCFFLGAVAVAFAGVGALAAGVAAAAAAAAGFSSLVATTGLERRARTRRGKVGDQHSCTGRADPDDSDGRDALGSLGRLGSGGSGSGSGGGGGVGRRGSGDNRGRLSSRGRDSLGRRLQLGVLLGDRDVVAWQTRRGGGRRDVSEVYLESDTGRADADAPSALSSPPGATVVRSVTGPFSPSGAPRLSSGFEP
jgi:hypothetical protein